MGDPDALLDAVRDKLRAIPAVVELVNGVATNIASYLDDAPSVFEALNQMDEPSILLVLDSSDGGEFEKAGYSYSVIGYLRLGSQRRGGAFKTICSGVPTGGDGLPFHYGQIHPDFAMVGVPQFRRDQDDDGIEYPAIALRFQDLTNS